MSARVVVVAGPNKGAVYFLKDGPNTIGRTNTNDIFLSDKRVSKKHCSLNFFEGKVEIEDLGSSNGSFVNGVLAKKKELKTNDRISLGPFVLELIVTEDAGAVNMIGGDTLGVGDMDATSTINVGSTDDFERQVSQNKKAPKSLVKKLIYKFDGFVLPVMYDFNKKHDWGVLFASMFLLYVLLNIGFSVYPLLETSRHTVVKEAMVRAEYIAKQMSYLNLKYVAEDKEELINVDFAEQDLAVQEAVMVDLEGRVMAPGNKVNEVYTNPYVRRHLTKIKKGRQKDWGGKKVLIREKNIAVITHPVLALSDSGLNVPKALSVVIFDVTKVSLDTGTMAAVYFENLLISIFLGAFLVYIVFRLTSNLFISLNDDIDSVLRGEGVDVEKKYQFAPLNSLIDSVNSILSRVPKSNEEQETEGSDISEMEQTLVNNMFASIQSFVSSGFTPMMLLDPDGRIIAMNHLFEDLTGIHHEGSQGVHISEVARDESLAAMVEELMGSSQGSGPDGSFEQYEFSSGLHKVHCMALTPMPEKVEAYMVVAEKEES